MAPAPRRSADRALLRDRPARSTAVKRAAVLTPEQIAAMLEAASPRDAALVVLMCVGAMRVGETTLLAWQDVEECSITIPFWWWGTPRATPATTCTQQGAG